MSHRTLVFSETQFGEFHLKGTWREWNGFIWLGNLEVLWDLLYVIKVNVFKTLLGTIYGSASLIDTMITLKQNHLTQDFKLNWDTIILSKYLKKE